MRSISRFVTLVAIPILVGCLGQDYKTQTTVHPDGSLEKSVIFAVNDSAKITDNLLGASTRTGWKRKIGMRFDTTASFPIRFSRRFASAEAANADSAYSKGRRIKIISEFKDEDTWFFNTLSYSDTYVSPLHFADVSPSHYFTPDDLAFLHRCGLGNPLSHMDSLRKDTLDDKRERYIERGVFGIAMRVLIERCKERSLDSKWIDTLRAHHEHIFRVVSKSDFDPSLFQSMVIDSLSVPLLPKDFDKEFKDDTDSLSILPLFDSFSHIIQMPEDITSSNADSVNGEFAFWKVGPDFLLQDNVMRVETREIHFQFMVLVLVLAILVLLGLRALLKLAGDSTKSD